MRYLCLCCCLFILATSPALAAEIYGQIWLAANNQAPAGGTISANCGGDPAEIDRKGRYRLTRLPKRQNCTLTVHYRGTTSSSADIYTRSNRNAANFMLQASGNRLLLIRR